MERCRMIFSGSGGQGVITAAIILAEAAVVYDTLVAVQSQAQLAQPIKLSTASMRKKAR